MKQTVVMGASGRMGQEVIGQLKSSLTLDFHSGVAQEGGDYVAAPEKLNAGEIDLVIDFSLPDGFEKILSFCVENRIPLVSGTTGLSDMQFQSIATAGRTIPVLWASNMSIGVAFMNSMLTKYSAIKHFEFGIEELHHSKKKDSPSGTALTLKSSLEQAIEKPVDQVVALRGGGIYGIHKVWAMSPDETITLEHTALNRTVFAAGAVRAAEWLVSQPAGQYQLSDVLGL